jgi:metallo-beta-lactamase family protein
MAIELAFLGAARNVTGSAYLVEANGARVLVDCGLYQERELRARNWQPFPVTPESIDAVILTHAHLDHCGLVPKLVRDGFAGAIHCTAVTAEIARIVLLDSAKIQEEDAAYKSRRHRKEGRKVRFPEVPLYTARDAETVFNRFSGCAYEEPVPVAKGMEARFHDAGHILGSSAVELAVSQDGRARTLVFSGDVGRWDRPIIEDPTLIERADYITVESTYGDRVHKGKRDTDDRLVEVIRHACDKGGNIVIPSFAIERSQELLYRLNELLIEGRIPELAVFLDSPMAASVTKVFEAHPELFDKEMTELVNNKMSPFHFSGLKMVGSTSESKALNRLRGTSIIIAGSGMCTGGRVKHHLVNNISRPQNTVLFVGYQASGTLGRRILEGEKVVRILGQDRKVRARVERINGFSAHADREELLRWLSGFKSEPRRLFVTHGEPLAAQHFAEFVKAKTGWETFVPAYRDRIELD